MLTIRQNLLETIRGGDPDRFVNQYEYMKLVSNPVSRGRSGTCPKGGTMVNDWGVTYSWPEHVVAPFPVHTPDKLVVKDISKWRETIIAPDPHSFSEEEWARYVDDMAAVDRKEYFATAMAAPGIFERLHYLMGMTDCLANFHEEPEFIREMIDYIADWEIELAKEIVAHQHPDALFHHDDWGTQTRSFLAPETFAEFLVPAYQRVYGFWKQNGVQVIVHHSDSYAANLVPYMIEMGIDVYQGAVSENNIPELIRKYGGKISFHGGIDNGKFDKEDWSHEALRSTLRELVEKSGKHYLIPGFTMGGPGTTYPGIYDTLTEEIQALSKEFFK
ncbi:MAG: uroporphyrinogen decarboxylase [Clostridiales bacterium]|nr:uroporphyrinogen decarboxylase [Clostridiales bacterium]